MRSNLELVEEQQKIFSRSNQTESGYFDSPIH